jgi:hypothetical protein
LRISSPVIGSVVIMITPPPHVVVLPLSTLGGSIER